MYYYNARWYDQKTGRFSTEDPLRDGNNWYMYCQNNPMTWIDPTGWEKLVISGTDEMNGHHSPYNFIETAILQLKELTKDNPEGEKITWLIADEGWNDEEKVQFQKTADELGVNLVFFKTTDELEKYINHGEETSDRHGMREKDKITKIIIFAHGRPDQIMFGKSGSQLSSLDFTEEDILSLDSQAFDENVETIFYSCRATNGMSDSFAQKWVNKTGGRAIAPSSPGKWDDAGRTNYVEGGSHNILEKIFASVYLNHEHNGRSAHYFYNGAWKLPGLHPDGGFWCIFTPQGG
jgi:hypothetical protein